MRYFALALVALSVISCNRDPNYLKQKYLQSGIKYFDGGPSCGESLCRVEHTPMEDITRHDTRCPESGPGWA